MVEIKFGFKVGTGVQIFEFCSDPDGTSLQWYRKTDEVVELSGRKLIAQRQLDFKGACHDTGVYYSHLGELAKRMVTEAPSGSSLVALVDSSSCGTRTFRESLVGEYYR